MTVLSTLTLGGSSIVLRRACVQDLPRIVELLADDQLGAGREEPANPDRVDPYVGAFHAIDADTAQLLVVAVDGQHVVATMQLSFIPGLARRAALRAQIEAVRIAASHRSRGLGSAMLSWAIEEARHRGCALVQLTTDKTRCDARRFYQRLGFVASHEGLKLPL